MKKFSINPMRQIEIEVAVAITAGLALWLIW
jgi:hypothetical protein